MNSDDLSLTPGEFVRCAHLLAAANQYVWVGWEVFIVPPLERNLESTVTLLRFGRLPQEVDLQLLSDAQRAVSFVESIAGTFDMKLVVLAMHERRRGQFRAAIEHAITLDAESFGIWRAERRQPFIQLSCEQQRHLYEAAVEDVMVIAGSSGITLPFPPPTVPQRPVSTWWRRRKHGLGLHGSYDISVDPWHVICLACDITRSCY